MLRWQASKNGSWENVVGKSHAASHYNFSLQPRRRRRRGTLRSGCGGTVHFCCWTYGFTHYMAHVIPSPIDLELNLESSIFPMLMFTQSKRAVRPEWAAEEYVTTAAFVTNTVVVAAVCLLLWIWNFCCRPFFSEQCHSLVWYFISKYLWIKWHWHFGLYCLPFNC